MRFSVDAHAIGRHLTGNEVYIRNLLREFSALDPESRFIAYVCQDGTLPALPARMERRTVSTNPFRRLGLDLPRHLRHDRPDLIHVQYTAPLACPVPVVVSVHDVSYLEHPAFFTASRVFQLKWTVKRTIRRAARVLCPSEFSRRTIESAYPFASGKTVVVPNAVSSAFRPVARETAAAFVHARTGIPGPYLLTVGDLQPRKNHIGLIRAFSELLRAHPNLPHRLLFAGKSTWFGGEVRRAAAESGCASRIHFTGWVSDEDLLYYYGGCDVFVFPSFYEGFGLPILEAMACGRAVACSNASAMPEVADSCAILFDPRSTVGMMRAMRDLLLDGELRARMERLGLQRAALFSWQTAARRTLEVYYQVAGVKRPALRSMQATVGS